MAKRHNPNVSDAQFGPPPAIHEAWDEMLREPEAGKGMLSMEQAMKYVDPNIPLDKLEKQDAGYIQNLQSHIGTRGIKRPIVVDFGREQPMIWDGHHRLLALKRLGHKEVPYKERDDG